MNQEIKEKMPNWCTDVETKFQLLMSDDIDALMCYTMQNRKFHRECEYFIDMSSDKAYQYRNGQRHNGEQFLYSTTDATMKTDDMLALDVSINRNTKSWDNHIVQLSENETNYNNLSANMNIAMNINKSNYTSKFCISTFITLLSYYKTNITKWDKDQLALLCAIDGVYQPFAKGFIATGTKNLKVLGFEFLVDFISENMQYIQEIDNKYLQKKSIWVNKDGYLKTNLDLKKISELFNLPIELPKKQFTQCGSFKSKVFNAKSFRDKNEIETMYGKKIFNIALTYRDSGIVSFID